MSDTQTLFKQYYSSSQESNQSMQVSDVRQSRFYDTILHYVVKT